MSTNGQGGHRVPFVARWPKGIEPATVSDELTCTTDFLVTCAEIVGVPLANDAGEDSVSYLPALEGTDIPNGDDRLVIHHSDANILLSDAASGQSCSMISADQIVAIHARTI